MAHLYHNPFPNHNNRQHPVRAWLRGNVVLAPLLAMVANAPPQQQAIGLPLPVAMAAELSAIEQASFFASTPAAGALMRRWVAEVRQRDMDCEHASLRVAKSKYACNCCLGPRSPLSNSPPFKIILPLVSSRCSRATMSALPFAQP